MQRIIEELKYIVIPLLLVGASTLSLFTTIFLGRKISSKVISLEYLDDKYNKYLSSNKSIRYLAVVIAIIIYLLYNFGREIQKLGFLGG